jgi:hypothetical protein
MEDCLQMLRVTENCVFILNASSEFTKFNKLIRRNGLVLKFEFLKEDFTDTVSRIKNGYLRCKDQWTYSLNRLSVL